MSMKNFNAESFLRDHWQKKPMLIKGAFPHFEDLVSPDELAGLSCEEGSFSKIITREERNYRVMEGPFDEETYKETPESHWTLMVQEVDHWSSDVFDFKKHFEFIPSWRLDDISVSYAADQGSVGAHLDHYDVFIVQGKGTRIWKLESRQRPLHECGENHLIEHEDLKLLKDFGADIEWQLETGDVLYIPPRFAHFGVSCGESLSYSVGFRAPSVKEMVLSYVKEKLDDLDDDLLYEDPDLQVQKDVNEITELSPKGISHWPKWIERPSASSLKWFGEVVTEPKRGGENVLEDFDATSLKKQLKNHSLIRSGDSRLAFHQGEKIEFFVNGTSFELEKKYLPFIKPLCDLKVIKGSDLQAYLSSQEIVDLLVYLVNRNVFYFD